MQQEHKIYRNSRSHNEQLQIMNNEICRNPKSHKQRNHE